MDEETPKPKQYLLMADEITMAYLGKLIPSMRFVEVEGRSVIENNEYMLLVNPVPKKEEEIADGSSS